MKSNPLGKTFPILLGAVILSLSAVSTVYAFKIDTGNPDWNVNLDTTLKYSVGVRQAERDPALVTPAATKGNTDDGDRNFDRWDLTSNRFDVLMEADVVYKKSFGARVSGAGWYDFVYNTTNSNDSPETFNPTSVSHDHFTKETRDRMGRKADLLDAFVFGTGKVGDMDWGVRAGRHTLLWGESLIFTSNGVAAGQAPIDAVKAQGVPGTLAKELFMPVTQVSAQVSPVKNVDLMGYYQFEWRRTIIPPSGSYFSSADMLDEGGERLLLAGTSAGPSLRRGDDLRGSNSGQFGVGTRIRVEALDTEFGLYYVRYHSKTPFLYVRPVNGIYQLAFPEDINIYAASFSTVLLKASVAGEIGYRTNMPLTSGSLVSMSMAGDNKDNPLYAVGKTGHAQLNAIYVAGPTPLWDSNSFTFEVIGVRRLSVTKNPNALDRSRNKDFFAAQLVMEPTYLSVVPATLDLSIPMSVGYNFSGKSPIDTSNSQTGSFSVGITAKLWAVNKATLKYTNYFGSASRQPLEDRDFISFVVSRTI